MGYMVQKLIRFLQVVSKNIGAQVCETFHHIRQKGPDQLQFWVIALAVGVVAGFATVLFRLAIQNLQKLLYATNDTSLILAVDALAWYWVIMIPVLGGLCVGLILYRYTPDGYARGVAHVIKGAALHEGRVEGKPGLASVFASLITLSAGGSTGREGPVVHLGALISSKISRWLNADGITARDLMGCAVAAAVSASFNAPIAGTLFALEVILRHYAVHAFAPIVIASAAGAIVSRLAFGDVTEFILPEVSLQFYSELPAFALLGLLCGLVGAVTVKTVFFAEDIGDQVQDRLKMPPWLRPAVAGFFLGVLALFFPHIVGVGYETTWDALNGRIGFWAAVLFVVTKVIAVAITFAGRMGGGIFSPSLLIGALTGLAFGWIASGIFPSVESYVILYALAGMAAVAAAVLGAPISTALIVFEMTGDWQAGLAVMISVSLSSVLANRLVHRSFFLTQLERAGVHLAAGPQTYLLATVKVTDVMQDISEKGLNDAKYKSLLDEGTFINITASLEHAMPLFTQTGETVLPVAQEDGVNPPVLKGVLHEIDALRAFNKVLTETVREEHS